MFNMPTLDVDAVRAFTLVADFQSFTRAAEAMDTTQAAISMKLKRLEDRLGHKLIERTPRLVRLSARGAVFLDAAREFVAAHERALAELSGAERRLTLGISDHVAGPDLPILLTRLHAYDASLQIEVQIESSRRLLDAFERGKLDAAILRREDDRRSGEVLALEPLGWFASPGFVHREGAPLRLAWRPANWTQRGFLGLMCSSAGALRLSLRPYRPDWLSEHWRIASRRSV
jgi:DNA-binding transcriptional LysR family regulator